MARRLRRRRAENGGAEEIAGLRLPERLSQPRHPGGGGGDDHGGAHGRDREAVPRARESPAPGVVAPRRRELRHVDAVAREVLRPAAGFRRQRGGHHLESVRPGDLHGAILPYGVAACSGRPHSAASSRSSRREATPRTSVRKSVSDPMRARSARSSSPSGWIESARARVGTEPGEVGLVDAADHDPGRGELLARLLHQPLRLGDPSPGQEIVDGEVKLPERLVPASPEIPRLVGRVLGHVADRGGGIAEALEDPPGHLVPDDVGDGLVHGAELLRAEVGETERIEGEVVVHPLVRGGRDGPRVAAARGSRRPGRARRLPSAAPGRRCPRPPPPPRAPVPRPPRAPDRGPAARRRRARCGGAER